MQPVHVDEAEQALLTRFNVQLTTGSDVGVSNAWLEPRIELFASVCAPSVAAQSGGACPWFVVVDARTPVPALDRIQRACAGTDARVLPLAGVYSDLLLREALAGHLSRARPHLVTSRLDNDDALAADYLDTVLEQARPVEQEVLVATRGYQLAGSRAYAVTDPCSPFLTMVERTRPQPVTVFCAPHHEVHRAFATRPLTGGRLWVQSIHGDNIANIVTGARVDNATLRRTLPHLDLVPDTHDAGFTRDCARSWVRAQGHLLRWRLWSTFSR